MEVDTYTEPVNKLLELGSKSIYEDEWIDYRSFGFGPEHVQDLIRMMMDERLSSADGDSPQFWAPQHAGRALAQLRALDALEPLLSGLTATQERDEEWLIDDVSEILGLIGPAAIPQAAAYLADDSKPLHARIAVADGLKLIAHGNSETRDEVVALLRRHLEQFEQNHPGLNAILIAALVHLKDAGAAPTIEQAFAAERVETFLIGDWLDVKLDMGLEVTKDERHEAEARRKLRASVFEPVLFPQRSRDSSAARSKAKAKRKEARKSRKQNRRRR